MKGEVVFGHMRLGVVRGDAQIVLERGIVPRYHPTTRSHSLRSSMPLRSRMLASLVGVGTIVVAIKRCQGEPSP